jgi:hypothetical protein
MRLRNIILSIDFAAAVAAFVAVVAFLPPLIPNSMAKDIYLMGISVLSIIFSVFFAALAIIVTSGDDGFIKFLQQTNLYLRLIGFFKFTVEILFIALVFSIVLYVFTAKFSDANSTQSKFWLASFAFAFFWAIFAAFYSTGDAIKYAERRVDFLGRSTPPAPPTP